MRWSSGLFLLAILGACSALFTAPLDIKECTSKGCTAVTKRVALDVSSNHTGPAGEPLIKSHGDSLTLQYGGRNTGGPRVYLIEEDGTNENHMFMLKGNEFTFDIELSSMPCGFNAALYFVGMTANKGEAENGTNYCDAQAVDGTFCSEMDIMEANTEAQQFTTHACVDACGSFTTAAKMCKSNGQPSTVCDQSGCGLNPFRYGPGTTYNTETNNADWYGPGSSWKLDSSKPYTAVTQFNAEAGGSGVLANITRFYLQDGKRVDLPTLYVLPPKDGQHMGPFSEPAITKGFCGDIYDRWTGGSAVAPLAQMGVNMEKGMVLAMSAWYAQETYQNGRPASGSQTGMSWLDGVNDWGKIIKAGPCHTDTSDNAGPYHATFSNIRFGPIGSTVPNIPPAPPGPPGPPKPTAGKCCYNGCSSGNCATEGFCAESKSNCEGNCNGQWCPQ